MVQTVIRPHQLALRCGARGRFGRPVTPALEDGFDASRRSRGSPQAGARVETATPWSVLDRGRLREQVGHLVVGRRTATGSSMMTPRVDRQRAGQLTTCFAAVEIATAAGRRDVVGVARGDAGSGPPAANPDRRTKPAVCAAPARGVRCAGHGQVVDEVRFMGNGASGLDGGLRPTTRRTLGPSYLDRTRVGGDAGEHLMSVDLPAPSGRSGQCTRPARCRGRTPRERGHPGNVLTTPVS